MLTYRQHCSIVFIVPVNGTDDATVAQLVEYDLAKVGVAGSSPVCRSSFSKFDIHATVAQLVEYNLAKVGVAGSNPVCRS